MRVAVAAPVIMWALALAGCAQKSEPSRSDSFSTGTNSNAVIAASAQSLTSQINQARSSFTNSEVEIREAAGASKASSNSLSENLRSRLKAEPSLNNVSAEIQGDTVILRGTVRSEKERQAVEAKVREVTRLPTIKNELKLTNK